MVDNRPMTSREQFLVAAIDLLHDGNLFEREAAVSALATLGDERHVPILLDTLQHDDSRRIQHRAAQAVARIGGEAATSGLQDLMRVDHPFTRFLAAEALANIVARGT